MPGSVLTEELVIPDVSGGGPGGKGGAGGPGEPGGGGPSGGARAVPQRAYLTGISLALGAILMFFMAFVSAYIVRKGTAGDWQPFELPRILWGTTLVLLISSVTIERARAAMGRSDQEGFLRWWRITTVLGLAFLAGQLLAWRQLAAAGVYLATNPASSFFYLLTAAHGAHLLGGIVALVAVAVRNVAPARMTRATAAEVTAMYWHFMDGLWIFLFLLLQLGR